MHRKYLGIMAVQRRFVFSEFASRFTFRKQIMYFLFVNNVIRFQVGGEGFYRSGVFTSKFGFM